MMIPLYLRTEPTTDATTRKLWPETQKRDVVAYRDQACTVPAGRWPWHYSNRPRRNCKRVMLNCNHLAAVWAEPGTVQTDALTQLNVAYRAGTIAYPGMCEPLTTTPQTETN